ncbi:adhesive plaque matrix protein [Anthonomus grandis grandis]|uniref:adhesive plaque matrix protein n=1 Tax=Anthonomus grandis grandis TaxID=2921223 RepID=UPI002165C4B9|nr:adhesive plaque matrix protein [Anthonomus grandis grandis]
MKLYLLLSAVASVVYCQQAKVQQYTTPVPILKQIDRHNDDGSYSYGYENADGTYKIETKYPTGEVYGKYGYIDDTGKLREVEYGASKRGFEPAGTEVTVAPPTLSNNPEALRPLGPEEEDDGQYREDPSIYYKNDPNNVPVEQPAYTTYARQQTYQLNNVPTYTPPAYTPPRPAYTPPTYTPPAYTPPVYNPPTYNNNYYNNNPVPAPTPMPQYNYNYAPQNSYWNPAPAYNNYNPNMFQGHPAQNVDIWTGSYTVNYRR